MDMNAAQRCWALPELVTIIVKSCVETPPTELSYPLGIQTLPALARTCRIVFYECLPVLWQFQDGLANLLKCWPPGMIAPVSYARERSRINCSDGLNVLVIKDPFGSDWDRFDMYARYVRVLTMTSHTYSTRFVDDELYEHFLRLNDSHPLLPALEVLHWTTYISAPKVHQISTFLRPSLISLYLALTTSDVHSVLDLVTRICPGIRELRLHVDHRVDIPYDILENALSSLTRLEVLSLTGFSSPPTALLRLATKHLSLRQLTVAVWQLLQSDADRWDDLSSSFKALTSFTLDVIDGPEHGWDHTLDSLHFPVLESIRLWHTGHLGPPPPLTTIAETLASRISHESLRSFEILTSRRDIKPRIPGYNLGYGSLQPLEVFKNLTHLQLEPVHPISWDNESLVKFVSAFPHLHSLVLDAQPTRDDLALEIAIRPTIEVLAPIVRLCPELIRLTLTVDATIPPSVVFAAGDWQTNTVLTTISLPDSPLAWNSTDAVAIFLYQLFPNLRTIEAARLSWDWMTDGCWKAVQENLPRIALENRLESLFSWVFPDNEA